MTWTSIDSGNQETSGHGKFVMHYASIGGGWLIRTVGAYEDGTPNPQWGISITFVPDAAHATPPVAT